MKPFYILLLLVLLWEIPRLTAQTALRFEPLSVGDGLSQHVVTSILQDTEGFMWFGTEAGLNKYDGYTFTQYHPDPKNPHNSLHDHFIRDLYEDKSGSLWASTTGLHLIDKRTGKISVFLVDPIQFAYWNIGLSIQEGQDGGIWFSAGGALNKYDPRTKRLTSFKTPQLTPNYGLARDNNGTFWMGSGSELLQFDPKVEEFAVFPFKHNVARDISITALMIDSGGMLWIGTNGAGLFHLDVGNPSTRVEAYNPGRKVNKRISNNGIFEDDRGIIWLATSEGLQRISKKDGDILTFRSDPSDPSSIGSNNVLAVYQDRNGILWVGTDNGINKAVTYPASFHTLQLAMSTFYSRLDENKVNAIVEDNHAKVWLGTVNGLYQVDIATNNFQKFPLSQATGNNAEDPNILTMRKDGAGRIWIGTEESLYLLNPQDNSLSQFPCEIPVRLMSIDNENKIWIPGGNSTSGNAVLAVFDTEDMQFTYTEYELNDPVGLRDRYMHDILASRSGDIYVAAGMWGLGRRDRNTGNFTHKLPNPQSPGSMIDNDFWCLYEDSEGLIWAGTRLGGLSRFDPGTGTFTSYTTHDGLPSNYVTSITSDLEGNLWLGTVNGLSRFDPKAVTFQNYGMEDGLPDNAFRLSAAYRGGKRLYFGTNNGLVFFDPDSILTHDSPPPIYITGLKIFETPWELPESSLSLSYDENFISFDFVALDYRSPEKIRYMYKLENFNQDWITSDIRRYASYTNLEPGEYVFRVKASNRDGMWEGQEAALSILIYPPWWKTNLAYFFYCLFGVALLLGFRQFILKRERLKSSLKVKELEAEQFRDLEKARSRFFANISHEFRTPLTLILGHLQTLRDTDVEESKQSVYFIMEQNANRLLHLINQLLELSKFESKTIKLELRHQNLEIFCKTLISSFQTLAMSRNITFDTQWEGINDVFYFDGDKFEKIIGNLISNAFKFTPDGGNIGFRVFMEVAREGKNKEEILTIIVSDNGIGIAEEEIGHIFDRFYQVDSSKTRKQGGTGIGLALVKELVDLHKGTIEVVSEIDKGAIFTVKLPLTRDETNEEPALPEPENGRWITGFFEEGRLPDLRSLQNTATTAFPDERPHLLVVEDNVDLAAFIASQFQPQFEVTEAYNGRQGLQTAIEIVPDVIICDVMMPEMDGIQLCEILKTDERTSHIPVVLLTAKAGEKEKIEGLEIGADDYLTKPFSGPELKIRVNNLYEGRKRLRERYSREVRLQPKAVAITSADEKFLERIMTILEENCMESTFGVDQLEMEVGLSRTQLYRKLKALTDQAPGEFLRNFRLQKAGMLLKSGHGNITEVAYGVGFNSLAYFTRCFREFYGKSPSEYVSAKKASGESTDF